MTGHVLETAWLCPACGRRVEAGWRAYRQGDAWRCGPCAYGHAETRPQRPRTRAEVLPRPGLPRVANREQPHARKAKGTTLEELLNAW